ncbi:1907_t:CDS:2 [Gigaspora rosea]|nr:1907_t:CDS:2 [Gigaspora rosea]
MAAVWHKAVKESIEYWKVKEDYETDRSKSFYHLINVDNGFSDEFIVGMFLNGLKGNNATLG